MKLFANRIQVILEDPVIIQYLVDTKYPQHQNSYTVSPPLIEIDLVVGFSSKAPNYKDKLVAFNQGLARIKRDGTYTKILKKWRLNSYKRTNDQI